MSTTHPIIDSHIHLWPSSAANNTSHAWMHEGDLLAKSHLLTDYARAATPNTVQGAVYIETDRRLGDPTSSPLADWTAHPTAELAFLRSVIEAEPAEATSDPGSASPPPLLALIPWAPVHLSPSVFETWLHHASCVAGPTTWSRVKGFRFLLQAITDRPAFEALVHSENFIAVLKAFRRPPDGRNYSFDVGVDQRSGGTWQLEAMADVIEKVHQGVVEGEGVVFVINHLCKPDFSHCAPDGGEGGEAEHADADADADAEKAFARWSTCMARFAACGNVYMKLSGAFSELYAGDAAPNHTAPVSVSALAIEARLRPWLSCVFRAFGPRRVMFGSDWPVCNVRGPAGEDGSWSLWRDVVAVALEEAGMSEDEKGWVWGGTAREAYRI